MRKLLLAAAAVVAMTGAAQGGEWGTYGTVGRWTIRTSNEACLAKSAYGPGIDLLFGVMADGTTGITVKNKAWNIPNGAYPVTVWIDNTSPVQFVANGQGNLVTFTYEMNESNFNLITKGDKLNITIGDDTYWFKLSGTSAMFPELIRCAGSLTEAANPFTDTPAAPVSTPSNPFKRI